MPNDDALIDALARQSASDESPLKLWNRDGRSVVPRTGYLIRVAGAVTHARPGSPEWRMLARDFLSFDFAPYYAARPTDDGRSAIVALVHVETADEAAPLAIAHDRGRVWNCAEQEPGMFAAGSSLDDAVSNMLDQLAEALGVEPPDGYRRRDPFVAGGSISLYERPS